MAKRTTCVRRSSVSESAKKMPIPWRFETHAHPGSPRRALYFSIGENQTSVMILSACLQRGCSDRSRYP